MNKQYKVIYLPLFYKDLENIVNYIAYKLNNIHAANDLLNEIQKAIESRALFRFI